MMDSSFNHTTTGFRFNPQVETDHHGGGFSGILDIYVHHARNIHNICIYDNQDVYAKFSLTCDPDETITTRIINGGGKNPEFNQNLAMKITQFDVVLKCEIWMLSRAKNFMEDQLLGFALVPISTLAGKGKISQDYILSSTDLFHSPAGTVKLTLSLNTNVLSSSSSSSEAAINSSITSEVVLLNRNIPESTLDPIEYTRIEFPDINVASENQQMVSRYFDLASFLHLGVSPECEMAANSSGESSNGFLSSTMTSLSDDRISSADSMEKKAHGSSAYPETPTSKKGDQPREVENKGEQESHKGDDSVQFGSAFSSRIGHGKMKMEVEQSEIQQQIVDMYMRSMQQFTESLAKMKLPMDLDHHKMEDEEKNGGIIQNNDNIKFSDENKNKKDGSRVFYGSRAFF